MRKIHFCVVNPFLGGRKVGRVLEAGCGTGYFSQVLQSELGWRVYPTDLAPEGLAYGSRMGLDRMTRANLTALPFADGSFDVVTSMDVLSYFGPGEESQPLAELARVLAPKGLLVLRVPALAALRSRHSQHVTERQRFTKRRLVGAVLDGGIRVLRCTYANSVLLPAALAKFRLWEPLTGRIPSSGVKPVPRWLDRLLHGCLQAESVWLGLGFNFPAGQSLVLVGEKVS